MQALQHEDVYETGIQRRRKQALKHVGNRYGRNANGHGRGRVRARRVLSRKPAILGVSALLALVALSAPTRRALRTRPVEAFGIRE
jgi:hypothetical protein